ncbi:MAG: pitrilysin family protein [Saprospiraceae bacterium]
MQKYTRTILNNGLTVLMVPYMHTQMACVSMLYKVGSRNEDPNKTGIAHLFEHLMFSNCGESIEFDELMQNAGGDSNAFTTQDTTQYYNVAPTKQLELMIQLEAARMNGFKVKKKDFNIQQKVVIEEFSEHYLNNPYGMFSHFLMPLAYKLHPYQWPVIGKNQDQISMLKYSDVENFFEKHYHPSNAILVISGQINESEALKLVDKYFGNIEKRNIEPQKFLLEEPQLEKRILTVPGDYPEEAMYVAFHASPRSCKEFYELDFATDILAEGKSSILYSKLRKEKMLFSSVDCYMTSTYDPGLIIFEGKLNKGVSTEQGLLAFSEVLDELKKNPMTDYTFEKYLNKNESAYISSQIGIVSQALNFSYSEWLGDANLVNTEFERYRNIQIADINASYNKYFNLEQANYLYFVK